MDLSAEKAALRKTVFAARKAAHATGTEAALAVRDEFLRAGFAAGAEVIAAYRPIRTEIDPTPLMEALAASGYRLAVPVIEGDGLPLRFAAWAPGSAMVAGAFGAEVPAQLDWVTPDLVVVPLVAFDRACWRLGYGGGFYDRSLEGLRAVRPTLAVGLAYAAQEVAAVPLEPTDQALDAIVTERGVLRRW
ncbi:MAG: 5-formyltetrahydrofolate cyclo-ligase [Pseudomonadota bacterium]